MISSQNCLLSSSEAHMFPWTPVDEYPLSACLQAPPSGPEPAPMAVAPQRVSTPPQAAPGPAPPARASASHGAGHRAGVLRLRHGETKLRLAGPQRRKPASERPSGTSWTSPSGPAPIADRSAHWEVPQTPPRQGTLPTHLLLLPPFP